MLMPEARELIVHYGRRLLTHGLTRGTGGNLSIADRARGLMAISPSGLDYFETTAEDVVVLDLQGRVVEGTRSPSVEHPMHRIFYTDRQDVNAVVHTHAVACTTMAALQWELPASSYLVALCGGTKVPCARYATFATEDFARAALEGMGQGFACFLANHGFVAAAPDVHVAFTIAEEIEHCAEIYLRARAVGEPTVIPDAEVSRLVGMLRAYGRKA
jgi:L-fuculose-phosphate aldolase